MVPHSFADWFSCLALGRIGNDKLQSNAHCRPLLLPLLLCLPWKVGLPLKDTLFHTWIGLKPVFLPLPFDICIFFFFTKVCCVFTRHWRCDRKLVVTRCAERVRTDPFQLMCATLWEPEGMRWWHRSPSASWGGSVGKQTLISFSLDSSCFFNYKTSGAPYPSESITSTLETKISPSLLVFMWLSSYI